MDAFALPHCPPRLDWRRYEHEAFKSLDKWLKASAVKVDVETRIDLLTASIKESLAQIASHLCFDRDKHMIKWVQRLSSHAQSLGQVHLAVTHGDFQPGNILIERSSNKVFIIDWEHSEQRFQFYDHLVYGLHSRWPKGLADRLRSFLLGKLTVRIHGEFVHDRKWRRSALSLFLLEDLNWLLAENTTGPYNRISDGLNSYCQELERLDSDL